MIFPPGASCTVTDLLELETLVQAGKPVLKDARAVNIEQVLCIALRLRDSEGQGQLQKARGLINSCMAIMSQKTDGIAEDDIQSVLYQASLRLLG